MAARFDEWGRPISDDGWYVWDGVQWIPRAQPAPPAAPGGIDLVAEVRTYPLTHRTLKGALLELPSHLGVGEMVLATAPGSSRISGMSIPQALLLGSGDPGVIVAATNARVLFGAYGGVGGSLRHVVGLAYGEVEEWRWGKRDFTASGAGMDAFVHQIPKSKVSELRAVVDPHLPPGLGRS